MAVQAALASRTSAPRDAARWTRAVVIALFAALAVLIHHEATAAPMAPSPSSAVHVMPGGMVMTGDPAPRAMETSGHAHAAAAASPAAAAGAGPAADGSDSAACAGMGMQHCAPVSVDEVTLVPPADSSASGDLNAHGAAALGAVPAGAVGRAPPDLSVLSQLRI
ncbi:hypothetical protein Stsp02_31540 [Streptomyces sp. NBRC 14336]|uniref:hypothetical protein n=1 Tax=Streptomyces TaxID=1883 RepID=UPI0024A214F5|nr:hypothetical protein [Streptomyces sp. NBRC 14336]GLW47492.1 hypothetical protein Stsp02_31540 [Streptomyces sp. NBRC 14336]